MSDVERRIIDARALMEGVEDHEHDIALYVSPLEDPTVALRRIKEFLYGRIGDSPALALIYVGLERVLDTLDGFQMVRTFERKQSG